MVPIGRLPDKDRLYLVEGWRRSAGDRLELFDAITPARRGLRHALEQIRIATGMTEVRSARLLRGREARRRLRSMVADPSFRLELPGPARRMAP